MTTLGEEKEPLWRDEIRNTEKMDEISSRWNRLETAVEIKRYAKTRQWRKNPSLDAVYHIT